MLRAALLLLAAAINHTDAEELRVGGSTTVQPVISAAAAAFHTLHPEVDISVISGGSESGITHAADGTLDIGMCSRPLNDQERAVHPDLVTTQIACDGLVFPVPTAVGITGITSAQVVGIYTGTITTWKQLGGADIPIVPVGRDKSHGASWVFDAFFKLESTQEFLGSAAMIHERVAGSATPGSVAIVVTGTNAESLAAVESHAGSITYCSAAAAEAAILQGEPLRILTLDGIAGSIATIRDGTYPLRRPLILLTKGKPTGAAQDFIAYVLSPLGQKIVEDLNFVPMTAVHP
jgi:phosphate transport system substrate-binding protein